MPRASLCLALLALGGVLSFVPPRPVRTVSSSLLAKEDDDLYESKFYDRSYDVLDKEVRRRNKDAKDEVESFEIKPVPRSKNSGSRFLAFVWDKDVDVHGRDANALHWDRNDLIEDHVMFIRQRNLYNETFNSDSMVDILRSYQL